MSLPVSHSKLITSDGWFVERNEQWPGVATSLKVKRILVDKKTDYQELLVFESEAHGNVLCLDGVIQLTERDEFAYHEMMCHTPLFAMDNPKSVLIIGGGDGGSIREVTKHSSVEKIVWREIDREVIAHSEKYFPKVACSNHDERVQLYCGDAGEYVKAAPPNSFDVIISDSSDPVGPAEVLFSAAFYQHCHRILKPGGILATQSECIWQHLPLIRDLVSQSRKIYASVAYAMMMCPTYPMGELGVLLCRKQSLPQSSQQIDVTSAVRPIPSAIEKTLRYYSPKIHKSAFVLPRFVEKTIYPNNSDPQTLTSKL